MEIKTSEHPTFITTTRHLILQAKCNGSKIRQFKWSVIVKHFVFFCRKALKSSSLSYCLT